MIPPQDFKELDEFLAAGGTVLDEGAAASLYQAPTPQQVVQGIVQHPIDDFLRQEGKLRQVDQSPEEVELQNECVDQVLATIQERGKIYGDPALSHHNIGLSWTGLIQQHYGIRLDHPLPAWLVELMLVAFKVHRSARVFHADNYVDAKAYLKFAENDQEKGIV